jgi:hypothetical protein
VASLFHFNGRQDRAKWDSLSRAPKASIASDIEPSLDSSMLIRRAECGDADAVWSIIGPIIAAGETYALDRDMTKEPALQCWMGSDRETFAAEDDGVVLGT